MSQGTKFGGLTELRAHLTPPLLAGRWPTYIRGWLGCFAISLLPLLVPLLVALLSVPVPLPPDFTAPEPPPALQAAEARRAEMLTDPAVALSPSPSELAEEMAALEAMAAEVGAAPAGGPAETAEVHRRYQARGRAVLALIASITLSLTMAWAQRRMIDRHTHSFWPGDNRGLPASEGGGKTDGHRPVYLAPEIVGASGLIAAILLGAYGLVPPWLTEPTPLLGERLLWVVLLAAAIAAFLLVSTITALGARIFAGNYPDVRRIEHIGRKILRGHQILMAERIGTPAAKLGRLRDAEYEHGPWVPSRIADHAKELWQASRLELPDLPVNRRMAPQHLKAVLDALMVALLVPLLAALIAAALWLDLALAATPAGEELRAALAATGDMLMVAAGVGSSAMLALIYLPAATRLAPYISAAEDQRAAPAPPANWRFGAIEPAVTDAQGRRAELAMWEPEPEEEENDFPREMILQLGCTRAKFVTIMQAAHYGAGLHEMLEKLGKARLREVVGLLAPTATGLLLALIG
ncbi:hypothetical protein [Pseudoroseicyclus tamaricis]|uniref:Uncharacterized protein n=1 Tax=Pseudoroseicyclus tamaricis TaxID=2705421 RepID=A0A6B2JXX9_9RHOB|nr:hypothetical protein [Pseudoroseicyclus tamaricis]NDV01134.1 hypothetical protein [Pseudoroseicyclus tamaricis]